MDILLLGGANPRHHDWIREFAPVLEAHGHSTTLLDYRHWLDPHASLDVEHEVRRLSELADGHEHYAVVAKSIGTAITILANARRRIDPAAAVFLGVPLRSIEEQHRDGEVYPGIAKLPATAVVQNEHDPFGDASEVSALVERVVPEATREGRVTVESVPGADTHDYLDFEHYATLLDGVLAR